MGALRKEVPSKQEKQAEGRKKPETLPGKVDPPLHQALKLNRLP